MNQLESGYECKNCGYILGSHAAYCLKCGTKREGEPETREEGEESLIHGTFARMAGVDGHRIFIMMESIVGPQSMVGSRKFCPECGESLDNLSK